LEDKLEDKGIFFYHQTHCDSEDMMVSDRHAALSVLFYIAAEVKVPEGLTHECKLTKETVLHLTYFLNI